MTTPTLQQVVDSLRRILDKYLPARAFVPTYAEDAADRREADELLAALAGIPVAVPVPDSSDRLARLEAVLRCDDLTEVVAVAARRAYWKVDHEQAVRFKALVEELRAG